MDTREVKAWEMTGDARISFRDGSWHVHSQTTSRYYQVNPSPTAAGVRVRGLRLCAASRASISSRFGCCWNAS